MGQCVELCLFWHMYAVLRLTDRTHQAQVHYAVPTFKSRKHVLCRLYFQMEGGAEICYVIILYFLPNFFYL